MRDPAIVAAFVEQYRADRQDGRVRSLAEYQARFPGFEDLIALEYADLQRQESRGEASPEAGERWIGPFKILKQLGRGGQGEVYLAEDPRLNRKIALKVLRGLGAYTDELLSRFQREAEITSRLEDPGICPVYESGVLNDVAYIAMRYAEGETLGHRIATTKERLSSKTGETIRVESDRINGATGEKHRTDERPDFDGILEAIQIIEKVARVLHAAHEAGIIHRDVKPSNVMVTPSGNPIVLDFGLARDESGALASLTASGEAFGTPAYMSPEQLTARLIRLDRRTDVWSLGVMLYECLTLERPFEAPTRQGLYQAILTRDPPDSRRLNPAVPDDLRIVLSTALEKDRDRRYQTALDLAEELRRVRMHEPIVAKPVGSIVRLQRWAQRNPALATSVTGLFAVLSVGLAVALFLLGQRDRALDAKGMALTEKTAALADYDRLGDSSRLAELIAEADELWPAQPSNVAAMTLWVDQASDLAKRLPSHREVRDRLRTSAGLLPYTDADRQADLEDHAADQEQLARLRLAREKIAATISAESRTASRPPESRSTPASPSSFEKDPIWVIDSTGHPIADPRTAVATLDDMIKSLDAQIHERATWKFESSADQFKHATVAKLVANLTAFMDPNATKGLLADVRGRLAFAESVQQETIGKYEKQWADAIKSIADKAQCPKYDGLEIKRQLGLIPIGKDPASGLWEFAHLQTTAPGTNPVPKRDKDGRLVVTETMGLVFVLIPSGTFRMGAVKPDEDQEPSEPNVDPEAHDNESPVTEIRLDPFFLSKYEMTQGQWLRLVRENRSYHGPGKNQEGKVLVVDLRNPVEWVSWGDCDQWLGRLGLMLPTEAQWEYAARGGTTTPRWTGTGTDGLAKAENLADAFWHQIYSDTRDYQTWNDGYAVHAPVGSLAANPFGLHDVLGNVTEFCCDYFGWYDATPRSGDGLRTPSSVRRSRTARGGCFTGVASYARSAFRTWTETDYRSQATGVRPARSLDRD